MDGRKIFIAGLQLNGSVVYMQYDGPDELFWTL